MPYLYARYLEHRLILKALSIGYSYLALWITINLSDLRYPLVLEFAGIPFFCVTNQTAFKKMQDHMALMNPITIAQFFHITCVDIMDHLVASNRQNGLLEPISHHYGIVKINGRSMLHLHCMLWLSGKLDLADIRSRLLEDKVYASQIIIYLDTIISCCVDDAILQTSILSSNQCISLSTR